MLLLGNGAETVVRRLLDLVRMTPMPLQDVGPLRLTVTAGLTLVAAGDTLELAVTRADQALLEGKMGGRDRYVIARAPGG
jgi:PleD family two-component response regulator